MTTKARRAPEKYVGSAAEIVGFLCRWILLGGAAILVAVVAWESLQATVGVSQAARGSFFVADSIARAGGEDDVHFYQWGMFEGLGQGSGAEMVTVARPAEQTRLLSQYGKDLFWVRWSGCRPGASTVVYQGVPYGALAFERHTARFLGVPAGRWVSLVDLRLADSARADRPDEWRRTLATMRAGGEVAMFFVGSADDYEAAQSKYRGSGGDGPLLFRREPMPYLLKRVARDLGRGKDEAIRVVTADADLASKAGRAGFVVHLIGRQPMAGPARPGVVPHASLERFKDSLPKLPALE